MPSDRHGLMSSKKVTSPISSPEDNNRNEKLLREKCAKLQHLDGRYFEVDYARSSLKGMIVAKCMLCDSLKKPICGFLGGSWHFGMHIQGRHPSEYDEYLKYVERPVSGTPGTLVTPNDPQEIYKEIVTRFILDCALTFSTVESSSVKKALDDLSLQESNKLQHLSKEDLDKQITNTYNEKTRLLRDKLSKLDRVCTTADIWRTNTERFFCVTVQWIDPESFGRKSAAIACRRIRESFSADRLGTIIDAIHEFFELNNQKIETNITGSVCCFAEAYRELHIEVPSEMISENELKDIVPKDNDGRLLERGRLSIGPIDQQHDEESSILPGFIQELRSASTISRRFHCVCRGLNLFVTEAVSTALDSSSFLLSLHEQSLYRCDRMWNILGQPRIRERLTKDWGTAFVESISERPSTVFRLFEWALKLNPKLTAACVFLGIAAPLRISDWTYIEEYSKCLRILVSSIEELQASKECAFGYVLPTLVYLRQRLTLLSEKYEFLYCKPLINALIAGVNEMFADYFNVEGVGLTAAVAAIVHPKFKTEWMTHLHEKARKSAHDEAARVARSVSTKYNLQSNTDAEMQLKRYLSEPCTENISSISVYPVIEKMFLRSNAPLAGSTPVERLFTRATMTNAPLLSQLPDEEFERLMLSACNARVWRQDFVL